MFFRRLNWNIIAQRNYWFALSAIVIIAGVVALVMHRGLPLGLSFTGGSTIDVKFSQTVSESAVRDALRSIDTKGFNAQDQAQYAALRAGEESVQLAQKPGDAAPNDRVLIAMQSAVNDPGPIYNAFDKSGLKVDRSQSQITSVGPSLSKEYLSKSLWALLIALILQLVYIAFRFGNQLRYGIVADIALIHDVIVMVGIYALANRKADDAFLAALLTVIGYSVMDSIVIFDRIRENGRVMPDMPYDQMVNTSLLQTMTRSVNTLATVLITLLALLLFGGDTLKNFAFALLVGVTSGAYSSIFIASPLLVIWKNADMRKRAAVRAAASTRDVKTIGAPRPARPLPVVDAGAAKVAPNAKRVSPKHKQPAVPPPRYRRKRPSSTAPPNPDGSVGILTQDPLHNGGDDSEERLPGDS
ncbi:MAG: protein translocase subunit SecF [Candidatus Eremiobacter antarcticus]|nr:protein translocase subunit SecF [Candidatus Eremiobacteraeota bacterium]MBC5807762.1 protein translocase subunit SecF [Candidatus Eremiobacteraeota bacterium]PZR60619.1 MAG: protein translocase subunit SecF [Candidatus Eremiobacter sp. RRmetagenome_bin22]